MYGQLEDALTSITMQLRSAIEADAHQPPRANGKAWHARQFQKCTGVLYDLTVKHAAGFDLPEEHAAAIFDVYNEALSNVARHAGASRVAIALTITPHEVTLIVRDDGIGLGSADPAAGAGGFAAIRARSQTYNGSCEVAGARSGGTAVTVSLPLPRA